MSMKFIKMAVLTKMDALNQVTLLSLWMERLSEIALIKMHFELCVSQRTRSVL